MKTEGYQLQNRQWAAQTKERSLTFKREGQRLKERQNELKMREGLLAREECKVKLELKRQRSSNVCLPSRAGGERPADDLVMD